MQQLKIESPVDIKNIDKLKSEAYDRIMNDRIIQKFIKENDIPLSFINDNLGLFLRMEEENRPCVNCRNFKECNKELQKGYLTFVDSNETIYYEKCKYYKEFLKIADSYFISDFNKDLLFLKYTKNDIKDKVSNNLYFNIIKTILENKSLYISSKDNLDIVLELTVSAINYCLNQNKKIAVINSTTLRDKIEHYNRFEKDLFYNFKNDIENCDILVINSIGNEEKSDFFRYSFLLDLVTYRKSHNLTTIFTSYYKISELNEVYGGYNLLNKTRLLTNKFKECFEEIDFNTIYRK